MKTQHGNEYYAAPTARPKASTSREHGQDGEITKGARLGSKQAETKPQATKLYRRREILRVSRAGKRAATRNGPGALNISRQLRIDLASLERE
jgi:hypothetical protein